MSSTIKHSVIIPHLGRERHLRACLAYLGQAAVNHGLPCGRVEFFVVGDDPGPCDDHRVRVFVAATTPPDLALHSSEPLPFWKSHLLNQGIQYSTGDILTFLDADAIVGPEFFRHTERVFDEPLTYLTYRVRYLPMYASIGDGGIYTPNFNHYNDTQESGTDKYRKAYEAYGTPEAGQATSDLRPIFGNSQFSIRRDVLGDTRFDEEYYGRGFEDLAMMRTLWQREGDKFNVDIVTDPSGAMFHLQHPYSPGYGSDRWNVRNYKRYFGMT